mmetsp:Transcript_3610/g.16549  ORF Transcript_3610/g.16549 Transcript_3610/m.16549 type:complete len:203 (+) Transcript_3610:1684-2292(+)
MTFSLQMQSKHAIAAHSSCLVLESNPPVHSALASYSAAGAVAPSYVVALPVHLPRTMNSSTRHSVASTCSENSRSVARVSLDAWPVTPVVVQMLSQTREPSALGASHEMAGGREFWSDLVYTTAAAVMHSTMIMASHANARRIHALAPMTSRFSQMTSEPSGATWTHMRYPLNRSFLGRKYHAQRLFGLYSLTHFSFAVSVS